MSDVYAGDEDLLLGAEMQGLTQAFTFRILADADPDVLLRVASQLLLSNVAPYKVALQRIAPASVQIDAALRGITWNMAESIRRKLSQLTCADRVDMYRVTAAPGATHFESNPSSGSGA